MTSFSFQEALRYNLERNSKVYSCFLDASKAFDTIWHNGLFHKLHDFGIKGTCWRLLYNAYQSVESCVFFNGSISKWFPVRQSVRQGGVLSTTLFMLYQDDLNENLCKSAKGISINHRCCSNPTQADDVVLMSLTKSGLDELMEISYRHSCQWRYKLNPQKCVVMVFGETLAEHKRLSPQRFWTLGTSQVTERTEHTHVGISINIKLKPNIQEVAKAIRCSFVSIVGPGLSLNGWNPLISIKLYRQMCLPSACYGCELWGPLSAQDTKLLERSHRYCVKLAQRLPVRTRTDACTAMVKFPSLLMYIDYRKLIFLRRLMLSNDKKTVHHIYQAILKHYTENVTTTTGFIPDIVEVLKKYELSGYLEDFIKNGNVPGKFQWKTTSQKL